MKHLVLFFALVLLGACAHQRPNPAPAADTLSPRGELQQFLQGYTEAFNSRDLTRILALYAEDADVQLSGPDGGYRLDKEGLNAAFKLKQTVWNEQRLRLGEPILADFSQAPVGYLVVGEWPVQSESWSGTYQCAMVVVKREGRWLILREAASEDSL